MLKGFKEFITRGNVVDLAVAVVIGAAFGRVVTALVDGLFNPLIAAIFGKPDLTGVGTFTINGPSSALDWSCRSSSTSSSSPLRSTFSSSCR